MLFKTYKIQVSYGDGKPVESTIEARNGALAQDLALAKFPGARSIRVLGVLSERIHKEPSKPQNNLKKERPVKIAKPKSDPDLEPHPLFTDLTYGQVKQYEAMDREQKMESCLELYYEGLSQKQIAQQLGVGKTTVSSWLKVLLSK